MKLTAKTLRQFRKDRGLSQQQLAELAGYDRSYISKVETGADKMPPKTANKIAFRVDGALTHSTLGLIEYPIVELRKDRDE